MLLDKVTVPTLEEMLKPHMKKPAWPGLCDASVKARARKYAKKLGIWARLSKDVTPEVVESPIPVLKRSSYRDYRRTGSRARGQAEEGARARRYTDAALALWLDHPAVERARLLDDLQDTLWAWCETTSWVLPAHEGTTIDLASSRRARELAEVVWMFEDELEDEVKDRVRAEVTRRILDGACDWRRPDTWQTCEMNWSHVCNSNIIQVALYVIRDPRILAAYIHPFIRRLDYALNGFTDDGGCLEGPGYWNYGFGNYMDAAVVLHNRTGGALDLVHAPGLEDKIERICRFPLAAHIEGKYRATFADSHHGRIAADTALVVNRFFDIPELFAVASRGKGGLLDVGGWRGLSIYDGEKGGQSPASRDRLLPDLGMVKLTNGKDKARATLVAKAGRNNAPHNHNDVGSFIYFARGVPLLTDPGGPVYTRKTFGPKRYEILFCRSRGHSVPVIGGREQGAGGRFRGTLSASGLDSRGDKRAVIDMTGAYDVKGLKRLTRELVLHEDGTLSLSDSYEFARKPKAVEEAFVTFEKASVVRSGRAVRVGSGSASAVITAADTPGRFAVERLVEESKEGRAGHVLSRITFRPSKPAKVMTLKFEVNP